MVRMKIYKNHTPLRVSGCVCVCMHVCVHVRVVTKLQHVGDMFMKAWGLTIGGKCAHMVSNTLTQARAHTHTHT